MQTTTTADRHFDPHGRNGAGQSGYLATTAAGIQRFGTTEAEAIERAETQERLYREAGTLDDVLRNCPPIR